eukprot:5061263-Ditylum_brightwellii.AAC.1
MRRACSFQHAHWGLLSAHDKRVCSTFVITTTSLDFVDGITPVTTEAAPPGAATMSNQNTGA